MSAGTDVSESRMIKREEDDRGRKEVATFDFLGFTHYWADLAKDSGTQCAKPPAAGSAGRFVE